MLKLDFNFCLGKICPGKNLLSMLLLASGAASAQPFQKELPASSFVTIKQLASGNLVVAGLNSAGDRLLLGVYNRKGDVVGGKSIASAFGTVLIDPYSNKNIMAVDGDSLLLNVYSSSPTNGVHNTVFKTDIEGNIGWGKVYKNDDPTQTPRGGNGGIYKTSGGDYINASWSHSHVGGSFDYGGHIQRTNSLGEAKWSIHFNTGFVFLITAAESPNGNYTFGGGTSAPLLINTNPATGAVNWANSYKVGANANEGISLLPLADNSLIIVGSRIKPISRSTDRDAFIIRVDADGNVIWAKAFGTQTGNESLYNVRLASDGDLVACGGITGQGQGNTDGLFVKLDINGNLKWAKAIGTEAADSLSDLVEDDNFYYATGATGTSGWLVATSKGVESLACGEVAVTNFTVTDETSLVVKTARTYVATNYVEEVADAGEVVASSIVSELLCENSLPITLLSFDANVQGQKVLLQWATASETNNRLFVVERSNSGTDNWVMVGSLQGSGTTNAQRKYSFTDEYPLTGKSFYRLKQVDMNGQFSYSAIDDVFIGTNGSISIYPNPATSGKITIRSAKEISAIQVITSIGQVVQQVKNTTSSPNMVVPTNALSVGKYWLRVSHADGTTSTSSFVKQ